MEKTITSGFALASDTERPDGACAPRAHIVACDTAAHLPGWVANELTEVGWPATGGLVSPDAGQLPEWRVRYNEARRLRRREQCRAAHQRWLAKREVA